MMVKKTKRRRSHTPDCFFCQTGSWPDYKDPDLLSRFIGERGRIKPRGVTGVCPRHQRRLAREIKRARHLSLLPFIRRI